MRFGILGPLEATDGERPVEFVRPKQRAVLAVLLIEANRVIPLDRLIDLLWGGEPPAWATGALQVHISGLRAALEPDQPARMRNRFLVTQPPGYLLRVGPDDLDASQFETLAVRGHQALIDGRPTAARRVLKEGLALWRGPALAEFAFEPFAQHEAARLEELRATALEDRIEADLARGAHAAVIAELEALVAEHPIRERLWGLLMLALYRSERQTEALRAFARARTTLREEVGIQPGPALRRLEDEILRQAPSLNWQPPREDRPSVLTRPVVPERAPADRPVPTVRRGPLVGRDAEIQVLRHVVAEAHAGRGGLVLVSGEPGIGKTRLVEEVVAEATDVGIAVAWGRCHDEEGTPSCWPWVQVIRGLLHSQDRAALQGALGSGAGEIAQIVPEVKELATSLEPPAVLDPAAARFQLYDAVNRFLGGLAGHRPLVIVLDDIHWADPPSLQLVQFVGARVGETGVLLVVTFRDVDPTVGGPLAEVLGNLARVPAIHRTALSGLSEPECR
ncbi:MAG TPA: BTAD domain-containing putative transcriptional regulator, partial [Actinomycetes bacterium]|nr:BTAD domain-containing putative transcriptional regulator [Actinomycetes bacterium]